MRKAIFWIGFVALLAPTLERTGHAQTSSPKTAAFAPLEVTLMYGADRTNGVVGGCGCFWLGGGRAETNASFPFGISVVSEFAGQRASNINSTLSGLSFVSYLFGPRYSFRNHTRLVPFGQFLAGGVHGFDALFPGPGVYISNPDAFAFAAGGGINIKTTRRFGFRAIQADYFQTHLPNDGNNLQNHLRLAAGVILRFGSRENSE